MSSSLFALGSRPVAARCRKAGRVFAMRAVGFQAWASDKLLITCKSFRSGVLPQVVQRVKSASVHVSLLLAKA